MADHLETFRFRVNGVLTDVASITMGVVGSPVGDTVLADAAMTHADTGVYTAEFDETDGNDSYLATFTFVYGGETYTQPRTINAISQDDGEVDAVPNTFDQVFITYDGQGNPKDGVDVFFKLLKISSTSPPGSGSNEPFEATKTGDASTDIGHNTVQLWHGARYTVWAGSMGRHEDFTADRTNIDTGGMPRIIESD